MKITDFASAKQKARYARTQRKGDTACEVCGAPLKSYSLYIVEDQQGDMVPTDVPFDEVKHITLSVGSECARRLKGYVRSTEKVYP